ncbi:hypothetical protein [Streptomyces sp. NL15-2K]|uniref:hypothetical protein n=1 Tax=Streptomyces sp. NL15-2K TaxID=376149 RepID=UPI000FFAEC66|nr:MULTISPECIES: hypothetical protein [Actinomycetes]WKX11653.1 hypothetical protein Q4V64_30750 [Kutzneria buriramensis]GCB46866.1 hypothetical protein SNL152K_4168 [Streptomyces sp. NL15-2K]
MDGTDRPTSSKGRSRAQEPPTPYHHDRHRGGAVTLTAALATACEPDDIDTSLDCVSNADTIADSLKSIHEAGLDKSILNGDTNPDSSRIDAAATR